MVHRVRKFVEVGSGRIGYAMTAATLSDVSNGTKWNPDASFNVADAILDDPEFVFSAQNGFERRPCNGSGGKSEAEMTYDVYQATTDSDLRMATRPGAGLPNHVEPEDWELMPAGTSQLTDDIDVDIADRGFCFFRTCIKMMMAMPTG